MHVLILTFGFPTFSTTNTNKFFGGSFILPEALAYIKAGAKVTVLTIHVPGLPLKEIIKENFHIIRVPYFLPLRFQKIRVPNLPLYSKEGLLFRLFQLPVFLVVFLIYLLKYIPRCDVVHANWTPTAFLALPFSKLFHRPIFLTFRGSDITKLPIFFNKFIIKHVDGVFNWKLGDVTKYIKFFQGNYIDLPLITNIKKQRINHSIQKTYKRKNQNSIVFTFIGRLIEDKVQELKGVNIIIPAALKLINKYEKAGKFMIQILGDGPAMEKLKNQAKKLNIEEYVLFQGHQNDIFPYLHNSFAVLGGLGLNAVVQEVALSNRLNIMIDGKEWAGDVWKHKYNSILYKPNNTDSLAEAMNYIIENKTKCKHFSKRGNITIKQYTAGIDKGGGEYIKEFRNLINKKRNHSFFGFASSQDFED